MWKTVCDKVVCESWYVTKCAWKMVCDRWCVTKMCVSMWKTVCDKVVCVKVGIDKFQSVCERSSVTDGVWQRCASENCWQRLYDRWCVSKVCVKDGVWLAGVWQRCVWDGLWNQGGCHICEIVPRLPCETKVDDRRCHQVPRLPRKVPRRHARPKRAQARHPGPWVPRLPRKTKVDVRLCHACHAKRPWMWDCATPATWTKVDVTKCHACHAKCRGVTRDQAGPSAPPSAMSAMPATQNDRGCEIVPRLPRETKVDVTKCHACHAKCRGVMRDQAGPSAPPSAMSATPATQNDRGCEIAPRLPRETKVDVTKCHASHAKCRGVIRDSRLPRETKVDFTKCHACHAKMVCDRLYVTKLCVKLCMWQMVCDKVVC